MNATIKQSHTPGPWDIHGDPHSATYYVHGANRVCDLVKPQGFSRTPRETEANARLIAAAPDLLAACQQAMEWLALSDPEQEHPGVVKAIKSCRHAIAKATTP